MFFHVSNPIQKFQTDWVEYSTQSSIVIYKYCYTDYPVSFHVVIIVRAGIDGGLQAGHA